MSDIEDNVDKLDIVNKNVKFQNINGELKKSYINYAMSVIVSRALPDVRDGLKPVQRRILYTMHKMNIQPGSAYKKVARIVGEVMGKYHPHGDAAISDALVRMGQDFSLRYMLIDGQGNYGSIDGDPAAAMRYIEARLDKHGAEILKDLEQKTVDFSPNYDGNEIQPDILPAAFPNLLLNGAEGIAVGMATKIPPHNLNEVSNAILEALSLENIWFNNNKEFTKIDYNLMVKKVDDIDKLPKNRFYKFEINEDIQTLLNHIQGPDFPTGAEMYDKKEIDQIYLTGRGRILLRAVSSIEESKPGRFQIVITELPYQVNKANLIAKISQLYREKKVTGITDLRDESSQEGIRIVVDIKKDSQPKSVQNQLYKYTEMQKTFNANILALVDGEPHLLNLKQIIEYYISHRQEIIIRRNEFELGKLREREHILEGLLIALDNIDAVIETIRSSKDAEFAKEELMRKFNLSEIQSQAILDMQLRKLAALESLKIQEEYDQILKRISELLNLLSNPSEVIQTIRTEIEAIKARLGDKRRTKLFKGKIGEISEEDLIEKEDTIITISENGYIKRVKDDSYQIQKRGGVGKKAMGGEQGEDPIRHIFKCNTHDQILFFSNKGKVYSLKVYEVPEYLRTAKGLPVVNLIQVENEELITSVLTRTVDGHIIDEDIIQEDEINSEKLKKNKYLIMATRLGTIKKTELSEYDNIRSNGLIAIGLDDGDELIWVKPTSGKDTIMIVSQMGKSILFKEDDVRPMGRPAKGVRGIRIKKEDLVISMDVLRDKEVFLLTISEYGYGKLSELTQFTIQNRGGTGIFGARVNEKTGKLVVARLLDHPQKELLIISDRNNAIKIPTYNLPIQNRQTVGVKLIKLKDNDKVVTAAIV